jgi:serine protease
MNGGRQLVDVDSQNLHLLAASPAIDAGTAVDGLPKYDFDGEPRVVDGNHDGSPIVDLGADEFSVEACR